MKERLLEITSTASYLRRIERIQTQHSHSNIGLKQTKQHAGIEFKKANFYSKVWITRYLSQMKPIAVVLP